MPAISEADLQQVLDRPAGRRAAMVLAGCGFAVPRRAGAALTALAAACGPGSFRGLLPGLIGDLATAGDPDRALDGLDGLVAAAGAARGRELLERLGSDAAGRKLLLGLMSSSRAFTAALLRHPEWSDRVLRPEAAAEPPDAGRLREELAAELAAAESRAARLAVLRNFRRRHSLVTAALDAAGRCDLAMATARISAVADAVIGGALRCAAADCAAPATSLTVLGLGKLGGAELNYSSDIDLIFIGDRPDPSLPAVAEATIRYLSEPTDDGVAYRVDMRLRPEGAAGALVWDRASALEYYRSRARPWERQAMIKARPVAGDLEMGRQFLRAMEGFVWKAGLRPAEVARACQLRSEMVRAAAGPDGTFEVKSGIGGIRDVEFAVQILQLAHGAGHPELRCPGTLSALEAIERLGLLSAAKARVLRSGYEFLRRVEHCLQTMDELALHEVPADPAARSALARTLGFAGSPDNARTEFEAELTRCTGEIRELYQELCGQGASGEDLAGRLRALAAAEDETELVSLLSVLGFGGGRPTARLARRLLAIGPSAPAALAAVLERLRRGPAPDQGLANIERLADAGLLDRLAADAALREALLSVAERSEFLAGLLAASPGSMDLLPPGPQGRSRRGRELLRADLETALSSGTAPHGGGAALDLFRRRELLRVGARDLLDGQPVREVGAELSCLAELVLDRVMHMAGLADGVVVLAMGRLGGREMSYGSDLDLVFVDTGPGPVPSREVAEAVRLLETAGYQVDTRLRPAGISGQLVASLGGYRAYRDRGELAWWERLALVMARPVWGAPGAMCEVRAFIEETLYGAAPPADLAARTLEMRGRLERTAVEDDFKRGPGGLVDIEFVAEYLALAHGPRRPALRWLGVEDILTAATREGLLPPAESDRAIEAYGFLRQLEMRARVMSGRSVRALPADTLELARLARMMAPADIGAGSPTEWLRHAFEEHTAAARELLDRVLGA